MPRDPKTEANRRPEPHSPAKLVIEGNRRRNARLQHRFQAWVSLIDELGWAIVWQDSTDSTTENENARRDLAQSGQDANRPETVSALTQMLASNGRGLDFVVRADDLLIWRPLGSTISPKDSAPLTKRESVVLAWLKSGKTPAEIASILGVSRRTVEKHQQHLYRKLRVNSAAQAVVGS